VRIIQVINWVLLIIGGITAGVLSKEISSTTDVLSWKTWLAAAVAAGVVILTCFLSAPSYNPLQKAAGLRKLIFTAAAIAALTTFVWAALAPMFNR
jgi:hypothetical protein